MITSKHNNCRKKYVTFLGYERSGPKKKFGDFGDDEREELERLSPDFALKTEFSGHTPLYAQLDESVDVELRLA
jgi:hypothetical protein